MGKTTQQKSLRGIWSRCANARTASNILTTHKDCLVAEFIVTLWKQLLLLEKGNNHHHVASQKISRTQKWTRKEACAHEPTYFGHRYDNDKLCSSSKSTAVNINELDGRKSNRGVSIRKKHTNLQKAHMIEKNKRASRNTTVAEWVRKNNIGRWFEKHLGKQKTGWRNNNNKNVIMEKAVNNCYKNMKHSTSRNKHKKSPWHVSELEILRKTQEHRKKG